MENLLITGGLGHIGSYLLERYCQKYNVTVVDDLSNKNHHSLFTRPRENFKLIEGDYYYLQNLANYKTILHLAAVTDAANKSIPEEKFLLDNYKKAVDFLIRGVERGVRIIVPSTTSVYGKNRGSVDENGKLEPQSPYAKSKIQLEQILLSWIDQGEDIIVYRCGTIFGVSPGMRFHTAINKFCWQVANDQPLTIWEDNFELFRPYLGLSDARQAFTMAIDGDIKPGLYNVITNNYTLKQIVDLMKEESLKLFKREPEIDFVDTPLVNQYSYIVNDRKIRDLGMQPSASLSEGIRDTLLLLS